MASDHSGVAARGPEADPDRERRLYEVLADYFAAVEAGRAPDRAEWLARYPDWADEIVAFLEEQDRLLKLTEPFRPAAAEGPAGASGPTGGGSGIGFTAEHEPVNGSAGYPTGTKVRYIGDYELLGEIARGGMGIVFRARQRSLNRPAALKMLLAEDLASEADEQRFRREAEAAANLDHPHIVPIFEVGRHNGRSYFSMKLVEGGSLSQRLAEFAADPRAAARLLALVARAVHHAHQRGVLHRDLKPANILLGGGPETPIGELDPQVTDFGLARRVDGDPDLTQSGAILGTPSYMAPEQADGKRGSVTVATDVYGLGAVLYALLAGRPPFRGDSALETLAHVKDDAIEPPSRHGRRIDRDLETICLKCLEKEPARRYGSAEAVAEDLDRWLAGEPIQARPAGHLERAWRWCRRNPAVAALTGAVTMLLVAAVAGLAISNRTIARERDEARRQRQRSDRHAERARRAVDQMYTRFAEDWLANQPRLEPLQYEFLALALRSYEEMAAEESDRPEIRREVAIAHRRVGEIEFKLNHYARAEVAFRHSVQVLREQTDRGRSQPSERMQWAESELALGRLLRRSAREMEGKAAFRRAVAICQELIAEAPDLAEPRLLLADALVHVGTEAALREAMAVLADLNVEDSDRGRYLMILGNAHAYLGSALFDRGRPRESLPHHREALKIRDELVRRSPSSYMARRRLLISTTDLARDLTFVGQFEEALATRRDALARANELAGQFPAIPDNEFNVVVSLVTLGSILKEFDQFTEAEQHLRQALDRARAIVAKHPGTYDILGGCLVELGDLFRRQGRWKEAREAFEQVLVAPASESDRVTARSEIARRGLSEPRANEAEIAHVAELARRAIALTPAEPRHWSTLGLACYRAGDWQGAAAALEKWIQLDANEPASWLCLAMIRWRTGGRDEARRWYDKAVGWMAEHRSDDPEPRHLRAEAEVLLGIADATMPNGPAAFAGP
jgi:tetratricopeptide (TPR) repeat protein/tRNA A-37 threonylcarbamoyl transferase component Bud32